MTICTFRMTNLAGQYAPILFAQAGLPAGTASFLASGVSAILMLAISVPAFLYADSWGRRTSILSGGVGLSFCMFVIGSLYATNNVHFSGGAGRWAVIVLIFAFALIYCATWGVVARIYASEIQPAKTRAAANSLAQGMGFVSYLLTIIQPSATDCVTVYKLARRLDDPNLSCTFFLWGVLPLWRFVLLHRGGTLSPDARDPRAISRIHTGRVPCTRTEYLCS